MFVTQGMGLRIPAGELRISVGEDGAPTLELALFEVSLETWPYWLDIGLDHAVLAREARRELEAAVKQGNDAEKGAHLEAECKAGMVACSAAGFALDAFYESIRWHLPGMDTLVRDWNQANTARHQRVSETIRRATRFTNDQAKELRRLVREVFKYRGWAAHPPGDFRAPVLHEILGVGVEWRFVAFGAGNANTTVGLATDIITRCVRSPRRVDDAFVQWCEGAVKRVIPRKERRDAELGS